MKRGWTVAPRERIWVVITKPWSAMPERENFLDIFSSINGFSSDRS